MKREDIIDSLAYIDEEFIEEADLARGREKSDGHSGKVTPIRRKPVPTRRWGTLAAGFAVLIIAAAAFTGIQQTQRGKMNAAQSTGAAAAEDDQTEQIAAEPPLEMAAAAGEDNTASEKADAYAAEKTPQESKMANEIRVVSDAGEVIFALNDTPAAKSLLSQLPLTADTEPYSDNEIVFHPGKPLSTENGREGGGTAGYLGYFAPWDNVVMYYGDFSEYPGLYILGEAVSGKENINNIRGEITIESV